MKKNKATGNLIHRPGQCAFTLIELLVVIAIISLLVSIMLPSLNRAKQLAKSVLCLSNLRQLGIAANTYAGSYNGLFPIAYYTSINPVPTIFAWDFITIKDWSTSPATVTYKPGILWQGTDADKVHQCPSFEGTDNWMGEPYTGYNYNTSYIGRGQGTFRMTPASVEDVGIPAYTALFGDGEYSSGANKFMRAPWGDPADGGYSGKPGYDIAFWGRSAGTQGFRHLAKTNVVYCDGHAVPVRQLFTESYASDKINIAEGTGFISADNSAYDLD